VVATIPPFPAGTVEAVAKIVGDLYSGSELTRLASEVPLRDDPGEGNTKWRRLAHALSSHQARSQSGNALGKLTTVAMRPDRTLDRKRAADVARDDMDQALSIVGLRVLDDGRVATAKVARTDAEALARTKRLRSMLEQRAAHAQVLAYCREELLLQRVLRGGVRGDQRPGCPAA